ncbi:MAG: arginine repressor [Lachnospiraceae bacterium]|jgi:transcriptional regulator of arginine metabolism|nr:arginine repressor [Lachnospiraceae bacterium]MCI1726853.1 arginine repressor [Lachnospiraceae bacterium]
MKNARHEQILELITQHDIETQEELADQLRRAGFNVTQATVSRDIRQLELRKVSAGGGRQKYTTVNGGSGSLSMRYQRVLKDVYVSLDISYNIGVVKTVSGMAMAAAAALDSLDWREVLGCIAGDDTVMLVLRSPEDAGTLRKKLEEIMKEA